MLNLDILFLYIFFQKKSFLMLYSINRQNFIVWLPFLLEIMGSNMCTAIVCFPGCDAINFETDSNQAIFLRKWKNETKI